MDYRKVVVEGGAGGSGDVGVVGGGDRGKENVPVASNDNKGPKPKKKAVEVGGGGGRGKGKTPKAVNSQQEGAPGKKKGPVANSGSKSKTAPVFGFNRLHKFLDLPPDQVILYIHNDLEEWANLLTSTTLREDLLILVVSILGQKVCTEESLRQQQINILKSCTMAPEFTQSLVEVTSDITGGDYPHWNTHRTGATSVDRDPATLLGNLYSICSFVFKTMPAVTRDHAMLKAVIVMSKNAAAKIQDPNLVDKFAALRGQVEELSKVKREKEEATRRRQKRPAFSEQDELQFDTETPPDRIQDIAVIPSIQELRGNSEIFLRPNKKSGAYNDSSHYLDVQFRLFREDLVGPLRDGVKRFLNKKNDYLRKKFMPAWEFRLYKNVTFVKVVKELDCHVHKLQLAAQNYKKVPWSTSKRLIYGSLIILTTQGRPFEEGYTHFGIISSRKIAELEKGIISVSWEGSPPVYTEREYLMFESEVYLESRKHTLETLKTLDLDRFPMKKFIVDANPEVDPPKYLVGQNSGQTFQMKLVNGDMRAFHPLKMEEWPTPAELGLDVDQFAAFQAALTKEFAIIQGPPGTGKTFLGLKIADVLLSFQQLSRLRGETPSPITVVCYTNYALDQFLEGILDMYEEQGLSADILRIGGNSKSERMKEFTLSKVRQRKRQKRPKKYREAEERARGKMNKLEEMRTEGMELMMALQNPEGIVNFDSLLEWSQRSGDNNLTLRRICPPVLLQQFRKLFWFGINDAILKREDLNAELWINEEFQVLEETESHEAKNAQHFEGDEDPEAHELYNQDELMEHRILDELLMEAETGEMKNGEDPDWLSSAYLAKSSVRSCALEVEKIETSVKEAKNQKERKKMAKTVEEDLRVLRNRKEVLAKLFQLYRDKRLELPKVADVLSTLRQTGQKGSVKLEGLPLSERWTLYFAVAEEYRGEMAKMVGVLEQKLSMARREYQEVVEWGDSFIARDCQVVGLTTTGAAKHNKLLRKLKSKIVIVEEAAQVFEAQLVTCITTSCEHLIMIGDHRQLQPNPNVYELKTMYNLNVSLFERMLNNQLHCYQLKVQHRMRPDIADLIVGPIYEELLNADRVADYPDVKGVTKNVFFLTHSEPDSCVTDDDSRNKTNAHEADLLIGLCRYLILQGYRPHQINVLTPYRGQMFKLRTDMQKVESCKDVRMSTVDDFQGQENDIILLSLVRSNEEGDVGFVREDNRICVALSRAKQGLFVIGNMTAMTTKSDTWRQIKEKLDAKGFIGEELELVCQTHGNRTGVKVAADFLDKAPEGGCDQVCNVKLPCTHICQRLCHAVAKEPEEHKCEERCLRMCENQLHPCKGLCYQSPCPICHELVEKTLNCEGKHKLLLPCHRKVEEEVCKVPVSKLLACNEHTETLACYMNVKDYKCTATVTKILPSCQCNHPPKEMKCHEDPALKICKELVQEKIPKCGHEQMEECWKWDNPDDEIFCDRMVPKKSGYCDHPGVLVKCGDSDKPLKCQEKCQFGLPCGHACIKMCHGDDNDPEHLAVKCKRACGRSCSQGHKCKTKHPCFQACLPCTAKDLETLPCGHTMNLECHVFTNETYKCIQPCARTVPGCTHRCTNMCHENCGPCKEPVPKKASCQHEQTVPCCEPAKKENCRVPVLPRNVPICGHKDIRFPCKYEDASPEELAKLCTKKCDHMLISADETGCAHQCSGTCSECLQGRLHKKCQEKCGRSLVCGHRCDVPCSKACPPCRKPCGFRCEHSRWDHKKCGDQVPVCVEQCNWKCDHKQCEKQCGELCDREPCDEPCPEKLEKCGHDCIGFCGEPCPPLCRICDRDQLEEEMMILAVEDDIETARFVFLADCLPNGHTIEVGALQKWLTGSVSQEISMKTCPLHQSPIYNCRRFGNVIRSCYKDVEKVKQKACGNMKASRALRDAWVNKFRWGKVKSLEQLFPQSHAAIKNLLVQEVAKKHGMDSVPRTIDEYSMKSLDFITRSITKVADDLQDLWRKRKLEKEELEEVAAAYEKLFRGMLRRQPLSYQEMLDFNGELDRTDLFKQLMMRHSLETCNPGNLAGYPKYLEAERILASPLLLTEERKAELLKVMKELDDLLRSGLGITEREREDIVSAIGLGRGHWFKCPNGHIYVIGDCGGANQRSTCNVCSAPIGGVSHQLDPGNQLASEMDGATAPAYPTTLMRY